MHTYTLHTKKSLCQPCSHLHISIVAIITYLWVPFSARCIGWNVLPLIFILHCRMQSLLTEDSSHDDGDNDNSHNTGKPLSTPSRQTMSQCDPRQQSSFYNLLKCEDVSTAAAAFCIDLYIIFIMWSQVINYCVYNSIAIMKDCSEITAQGVLMYTTPSQSEDRLEYKTI